MSSFIPDWLAEQVKASEPFEDSEAISYAAWTALNTLALAGTVRLKDLPVERKVLNTLLSRQLVEETALDQFRLTRRGRVLTGRTGFDARLALTRNMVAELERLTEGYTSDADESRWRRNLEKVAGMTIKDGNGHAHGAVAEEFVNPAPTTKSKSNNTVNVNLPGMSIQVTFEPGKLQHWRDYQFHTVFRALSDIVHQASRA